MTDNLAPETQAAQALGEADAASGAHTDDGPPTVA